MKRAFFCAYLLIFSAFFLAFTLPPRNISSEYTNLEPAKPQNLDAAPAGLSTADIPSPHMISVDVNGECVELDLEELLTGVVSAEMPAEYPLEALKAQAVAARSYILYRENLPNTVHPTAQVCTDSTHCFAWLDDDALRKKWGADYEACRQKIALAVSSTAGEYMSYEGNPINAVFHAISSGLTESAEDIWSADIPYLSAVASAGEADSPTYLSNVSMSADELKAALKARYPEASLPDDISKCFDSITRSESGGVTSVSIGNLRLHGNEIRSIASLRSTNFTVAYSNGMFTFEVRGYGHGVGMSQYGAKVMADDGANYREILSHYYTGVDFEK